MGNRGRTSKRKEFILNELLRRVAKPEAGIEDESDDLQAEGKKIIFPSKFSDIWTS